MENTIYVLTEILVSNNNDLMYQKTFVYDGYTDELRAQIQDILDFGEKTDLVVEVNDNPQWLPLETAEPNEIAELKQSLPIKVITAHHPNYDGEPVYCATLTKTDVR